MRRPSNARIARHAQVKAIVSPVRQELLDALMRMGAVTVREMAAVLGRPADGLYYHVREMQRVGLVKAHGVRTRNGVKEELFAAVASDFELQYSSAPRAKRALGAVVAAMLRLGIRDYRRSLASGTVRVEGLDRDLWALRTIGWLQPAQLRQVNRRIRALQAAATKRKPVGRLYAVTVLLTPLDHRANSRGRRPRK